MKIGGHEEGIAKIEGRGEGMKILRLARLESSVISPMVKT